jgi:hypothetical protein
MGMTHTYAVLDISPAAYEEIKRRLESCSQPERLYKETDGTIVLDMNGIALRRENDEKVQVWLLFQGKKV